VAIDFFVVPTATFRILFGFLVLALDHRRVLHFNVTAHPTAEWTAWQLFQESVASRCHLSLAGDAPVTRGIHGPELGEIVENPEVGGLHHRYDRAHELAAA
jgi:hypothetical protein